MPKSKYKKRKDGRYATTIHIGYKEDGRPDTVTIYGKTIAELEQNKAEKLVNLSEGIAIKKVNITFGEYSCRWFKAKQVNISHKTVEMYDNVLRNHAAKFNTYILVDIKKTDIQLLINDKQDKPRLCEQIKLTLNQIFESAIDDNLIRKNPVRRITLPKKQKSDKRALTEAEYILTANANLNYRERVYVTLLKFYGLRKEEALALTSDDFDFKNKTITISKALTFIHNQPLVKDTKSIAGNRVLPMLKDTEAIFQSYINAHKVKWLFTNKNGNLISEQGFRCMYKKIIKELCAKADEMLLPHPEGLTSHIFRHNYATVAYYAGLGVKEAQYLLGQSTAAVTLDIYTHLDKESLNKSSKLEEYFNTKTAL